MAESDASRPTPGPLTTEEADRLSERFRPSWEVDTDGDPPTIPRVPTQPPAASPTTGAPLPPPRPSSLPGATPRPAAVAAPVARSKFPRAKTEQALATAARQASTTVKTDPLLAPVARAAVAATTPHAPIAATIATAKTDPLLGTAALAASAAVTSTPDTVPSSRIPSSPMVSITAHSPAIAEPRPPTLLGLSPPTGQQISEDLDWEVPTNPHPSPLPDHHEAKAARPAEPAPALGTNPASPELEPPMVEVEELPPESHPSGIGSKYVPKDLNAPPIVLKEEIQAAEAKQRQKLEVEHRSRRAATIIRMRAPDPVPAPVAADEEVSFPVRKSRTGLYVGAALVLLAGSVGLGAILQRKSAQPVAATVETAAPVVTTPVVTSEPEAPKPAQTVAVAGSAPPVVVAPAEPAVEAPARTAVKPEPAAAQVAVPTRPKAKAAATPTSKPAGASPAPKGGSKSPGSRSVIVRDTPF